MDDDDSHLLFFSSSSFLSFSQLYSSTSSSLGFFFASSDRVVGLPAPTVQSAAVAGAKKEEGMKRGGFVLHLLPNTSPVFPKKSGLSGWGEKTHAHTHTHLQRISASPFVFFFSKTTNNFGLFRIVTFWKMIITFLFFPPFLPGYTGDIVRVKKKKKKKTFFRDIIDEKGCVCSIMGVKGTVHKHTSYISSRRWPTRRRISMPTAHTHTHTTRRVLNSRFFLGLFLYFISNRRKNKPHRLGRTGPAGSRRLRKCATDTMTP